MICWYFKVKSPIPVRSGTVGPLKSKDGKESYGGGAHQYELLIDRGENFNWKDYFEIMSTQELK
ncbi:hypothetical protein LP092_15320 (plasmid) [Moraxella bovis]|uniref:Uncharacterized protein n=1 Tax=Moraxella bovis TaxID=476 RepID=A0ABY6MAV6_MORBO|nr:hypothetical protein [Moraxella bovis]UZA04738.1 hypothetical protein LP092_15320 [Moraxella bovis]